MKWTAQSARSIFSLIPVAAVVTVTVTIAIVIPAAAAIPVVVTVTAIRAPAVMATPAGMKPFDLHRVARSYLSLDGGRLKRRRCLGGG